MCNRRCLHMHVNKALYDMSDNKKYLRFGEAFAALLLLRLDQTGQISTYR